MPTIHQHKIRAQIEQDILPILREAPHAPTEEKQLLAAAFTVYAMQAVANLDIEDAIEALTDGPGDAGFDGLHFDGDTAYIFQTKWFDKADKQIGERDAARVLTSLKNFFDGAPLPGVSPRVEEKLRGMKGSPQNRVIFASSGDETHKKAKQLCENFRQSRKDFLAFEHLSAIDLARLSAPPSGRNRRKPSLLLLRGGAYPEGVVHTDVGDIRGIVGIATGADLVNFYKDSDSELSLFMNVRAFLGQGKISRNITKTARGDFARHFWFYEQRRFGRLRQLSSRAAKRRDAGDGRKSVDCQRSANRQFLVGNRQRHKRRGESFGADLRNPQRRFGRGSRKLDDQNHDWSQQPKPRFVAGFESQRRAASHRANYLRGERRFFGAQTRRVSIVGKKRSGKISSSQPGPIRHGFSGACVLARGAPHDAYAKKTQTIDKRFDKVFGREFSPDSFFRSYELLIFASRKKRAREIEAKTAKKDGGGNGIAYCATPSKP